MFRRFQKSSATDDGGDFGFFPAMVDAVIVTNNKMEQCHPNGESLCFLYICMSDCLDVSKI